MFMLFTKEVQMRLTHIKYLLILGFGLFLFKGILGQNNVGIGTNTPHPSAILHVKDSSRGVLIPRTDTLAILNNVSAMVPSPGIADGLMIFDTLLNTYVYYDLAQDRWKRLLDLIGPNGPRGAPGPTGPKGDTGVVNDWRDSLGFDQLILAEDTCGDWFFDRSTGRIWKVWCDTLGGGQPRRWVDTVLWDKPIGILPAPDERIIALTIHATTSLVESMANDVAIVSMVGVPGLNFNFILEPDETAYVWAAAHGTVSKAFAGDDISYAQYDMTTNIGQHYRGGNAQNIVTVGPNGPPSNTGLADFAGWYISAFSIVSGDVSPPINCRCGTPWQACIGPCNYGPQNVNVGVVAGNRYSGSATTSFLVLADTELKENVGHLSVFAIIRRNPNALPRKR